MHPSKLFQASSIALFFLLTCFAYSPAQEGGASGKVEPPPEERPVPVDSTVDTTAQDSAAKKARELELLKPQEGESSQTRYTSVAWVAPVRRFRAEFGDDSVVESIAFKKNSKGDGEGIIATGGSDGKVRVWSAATGAMLREMEGDLAYVSSVEFADVGKMLVAGGYDNTIRLWNEETGRLSGTLEGHEHIVLNIDVDPEAKWLASTSRDGQLLIRYRISLIEKTLVLGGGYYFNDVDFSPDGKWLATTATRFDSRDENNPRLQDMLILWTMDDWRDSVRISINDAEFARFSPDGSLLATSELKRVALREVPSGEVTGFLEGHDSFVNDIAFHPEGRIAATCGDDQSIRLWDVSSGELIQTLYEHTNMVMCLAFNREGTMMASGDEDGYVLLWKLRYLPGG